MDGIRSVETNRFVGDRFGQNVERHPSEFHRTIDCFEKDIRRRFGKFERLLQFSANASLVLLGQCGIGESDLNDICAYKK
jgi:hypothetical protein